MERNSKTIVWAMLTLLLIGMSMLTLNIQPVKANPDVTITITVLFSDNYPVEGAWTKITNDTNDWYWGMTNSSGQTSKSENLSPGWYWAKAYYPESDTYFAGQVFNVDSSVEYVTITGDYEITPPVIEILSPQNTTYPTTSIPLTFTVDDYSDISWTGYSLDNQANVTSGNTTLTVSLGPHNIIVYANDTYGNMGSSNKTYFTVDLPVGGIYIAPNRLELLAPYIAFVSLIFIAIVATTIYVKHVKRKKGKG